jgi:hypothetical protein
VASSLLDLVCAGCRVLLLSAFEWPPKGHFDSSVVW